MLYFSIKAPAGKQMRWKFGVLGTAIALYWVLCPASAGPIHELVLNGDSVWSGAPINWAGTEGYIVPLRESDVLTDFFTFDLTGYSGDATSGLLRLTRYWSGGPAPFSYTLSDVNAVLWGSGVTYGGVTVKAPGEPGNLLEIPLNAQALADLNTSREVFFSMGGRLEAATVHNPEPGTLVLLASGLLGAVILVCRRKRAR